MLNDKAKSQYKIFTIVIPSKDKKANPSQRMAPWHFPVKWWLNYASLTKGFTCSTQAVQELSLQRDCWIKKQSNWLNCDVLSKCKVGDVPLFTSMAFITLLLHLFQASGPPSSASSSGPPSTVQIPNMEESLQLMREMGIPNDDLSRQALQATNGDVQAAVNLIFAQWMADD